ncbi:methyltransferase domain-containing protein [Candidatus Peribacteria bacterium]|nr:methyltransferase domain-containing protein [Candidatus Peribacteria bacterium]
MIDLQRKLLGDTVRNDAFAEALRRVIKPGETTMIDLGSGTGFLSFLASRLGAKHVTLIEIGEILETSKALAKRNGIKNCTFLRKHSTQVHGLPKADVLVSETLGNYALEENILEAIEDGKRLLHQTGIVIPAGISQFVCPVVTDRVQKEIDVWPRVGFDLDFTEARQIAMNNIYVKTMQKSDLLSGAAREWDSIDFSKKNKSIRTADIVWKAATPMTVYGFALWWNAELTKGVELSTSPLAPITHWEQIYLPLLKPIECVKGSSVRLQLNSDTRWKVKVNLTWTVRLLDQHNKELSVQEMDMKKGLIG